MTTTKPLTMDEMAAIGYERMLAAGAAEEALTSLTDAAFDASDAAAAAIRAAAACPEPGYDARDILIDRLARLLGSEMYLAGYKCDVRLIAEEVRYGYNIALEGAEQDAPAAPMEGALAVAAPMKDALNALYTKIESASGAGQAIQTTWALLKEFGAATLSGVPSHREGEFLARAKELMPSGNVEQDALATVVQAGA